MAIHFEELWERCERFHQDKGGFTTSSDLLDELALKINLYKAIDAKGGDIPTEEAVKIKTRTLGEILLTITHLSLKDNVNTFDALASALQYRSVEHFSKSSKP